MIAHLGLQKCKLHAMQSVYWPRINDQLKQLVLNCQLCLKDTSSSLGQEIPLFPWTKLATDIFHFEGDSYLVLVDYTSCFPIVWKLKSMTTQHITDHIKQIFAEYGWPNTIVSDNRPCYTSETFRKLMIEYRVNHITSLPHYPQSNGLAEKYVQIIKNLFYKAKEEGQDLHKCLMIYRNTPLSNHLQSPMQILSSRSTRSTLSLSNAAKRQMGIQDEELRTRYKNQHLPTCALCLKQAVMFQELTSKKWYPATITKLCKEPRSYIITTANGIQYRRMQMHLKHYQLRSRTDNKELQRTPPCNDNQMQLRQRDKIKPPRRFQVV